MRFVFIRRAEGDVDPPAVGLPSRNAGGEALVGVGDAPVVLFFKLVFLRIRRRIAPQPELLDELLALLVGRKAPERRALFVGDDVEHVLVQPLFVRAFQLLAQFLFALAPLFFRHRLGDGLPLLLLFAFFVGGLGRRDEKARCNQGSGKQGKTANVHSISRGAPWL
jgi:hypothetical protein